MIKSFAAFFVFLVLLAAGIAEMYLIEEDNHGMLSGLLTIIVTIPLGLAWLLSAISAGLFIGALNSRQARVGAYVFQVFSSVIALIVLIILVSSGGSPREQTYPLFPLIAGLVVFFIPSIVRSAGNKT